MLTNFYFWQNCSLKPIPNTLGRYSNKGTIQSGLPPTARSVPLLFSRRDLHTSDLISNEANWQARLPSTSMLDSRSIRGNAWSHAMVLWASGNESTHLGPHISVIIGPTHFLSLWGSMCFQSWAVGDEKKVIFYNFFNTSLHFSAF